MPTPLAVLRNNEVPWRTQTFRQGYRLALLLLALVTVANYILFQRALGVQSATLVAAQLAAQQRDALARTSQIVGVILHSIEQSDIRGRLFERSRKELLTLSGQIEQGGQKLEQAIDRASNSSIGWLLEAEALTIDRHLFSTSSKVASAVYELSNMESDLLEWRFALFAPIQIELAASGELTQKVDALVTQLHARSMFITSQLNRVHTALLVTTILALLGELLFIFRPLFHRLQAAQAGLLQTSELLRRQAHLDPLTGIGNRFALNSLLENLRQKEQTLPLVFFLIDVDRFKALNDSYGFMAGDESLKSIAQRIVSLIGANGQAFRIGGDEFLCLFFDYSPELNFQELGERMLESIREPIILSQQVSAISVSACIGIDITGTQTESGSEANLQNASGALRDAKRRGVGQLEIFDAPSAVHQIKELKLAKEIENGLKAGEFVPYYQTVVEMNSGRVVGVEALARWIRPGSGVQMPGMFLPIIEQYGLDNLLTETMLKQVARDFPQLQKSTPSIEFACVNFPESMLADLALCENLIEILGGASMHWLHVEVVETAILNRSSERIISNLKRLSEMGIKIALDDFGTGYASLAHLKSFPCDYIKIDKSFVADLFLGTSAQPIVRGMVEIAHGIQKSVIVEGIETAEQRSFFDAMPSVFGQGYLFARPQPISTFVNRVEAAQLVS